MTEIWKPIDGYEERYEVSTYGRVRSKTVTMTQMAKKSSNSVHTYKGTILKPVEHSNGYLFVSLTLSGKSKVCSIHRLVAMTFIPNANNKTQVNHIDGNKHNNHVENLEWCTPKENMLHAVCNGLLHPYERKENHIKRGSENHMSRSIVQCDAITGEEIKTYGSMSEAASSIGVDHTGNISACCRGKRNSAYGYVWRYAS